MKLVLGRPERRGRLVGLHAGLERRRRRRCRDGVGLAGRPRGGTRSTLDLRTTSSRSDVALASRDDGRTVVTLTQDAVVQLWDVARQVLLQRAREVAGRHLIPEEWTEVLPDLPSARTCAD
jgi:hypothetical protein